MTVSKEEIMERFRENMKVNYELKQSLNFCKENVKRLRDENKELKQRMDMSINHLELNGDECRVSVDGKHLQFDNYEIANDVYDILAQMQKETILLELENDKLKKRNKELEYHLNNAKKELQEY